MRLSHDPLRIWASFDDPNLVSRGGLVPVMALAERAGLEALVGLNTLAVTVSTPQSAPVVARTRLRGGSANTARVAASFAAEAIGTARAARCTARS